MKRLAFLVFIACGGGVVAPPAEVAVAPPASTVSVRSAAADVPDGAPARQEDASDAGTTGNMWGDSLGDSFGAAGIDLRQVGVDGGGRGFSAGHRDGGAAVVPSLRQGQTVVTAKLPPEVIQRIVRQNFGRFRLCYENGLRTNAKLAGKVVVRFVIDPSGAVTKSDPVSDTDLPDAGVVSCVARGFANLSFPTPESGSVIVTYPVFFDPGS